MVSLLLTHFTPFSSTPVTDFVIAHRMLVLSMLIDSTYSGKTSSYFSNDKCSVLRKWKYSGAKVTSVEKKAGYLCKTHVTLVHLTDVEDFASFLFCYGFVLFIASKSFGDGRISSSGEIFLSHTSITGGFTMSLFFSY